MNGNIKQRNEKGINMIDEPCIYDDNITCHIETCSSKCPKNIYHKREDNDKK